MRFSGSVSKRFDFPAGQAETYRFLRQTEMLIDHFAGLAIVSEGEVDGAVIGMPTRTLPALRLLYGTKEMGVYAVKVYCDVVLYNQPDGMKIGLKPLSTDRSPFRPILPQIGPAGLETCGELDLSLTIIEKSLEKSAVDYQLCINTLIELGDVLGFMSNLVIKNMITPLMNSRLNEMVDHFSREIVAHYRARTSRR